MSELHDAINEELKDPQFKQAWEEGEVEYQIQRLLIRARIEEGLSQKELAEKTSIAQSNISAIERGARVPSLSTLQKLAHGLGRNLRIELVTANQDENYTLKTRMHNWDGKKQDSSEVDWGKSVGKEMCS